MESLDREVSRDWLDDLAKKNLLSPSAFERSLHVARLLPDRRAWQMFISNVSLFLGMALLLAGIIFFFAYNWASLHKAFKLGLVQALIIAAVVVAHYKGYENIVGKTSLLAASILVGALLAVYGQTYQTGADVYELFVGWCLLIVGWVFVSRFAALWFTWLVLLNFAVSLYWIQAHGSYDPWEKQSIYLLLAAVNIPALLLWEIFSQRGIAWLQARWMPRAITLAVQYLLVAPVLLAILDEKMAFSYILYTAFAAAVFWFYQTKEKDLFMLTANCFGVITVVSTLLGKIFVHDITHVLFLSIIILLQAGAAGYWLLKVAKSWQKN